MKLQGSGFLMGMVVGLLVGLSLALGVAIYVNKVPIPFVNKVPQRTADQDAAEAEKNKNWDPNSALRSKAILPPSSETGAPGAASAPGAQSQQPAPGAAGRPVTASKPAAPGVAAPTGAAGTINRPLADAPAVRGGPPPGARDPAAILGDAPMAASGVAGARPAPAPATRTGPDPFIYFVQAGAFAQTEEAEQQRAKLAMLGFEARLSEREQSGRTMFRVRVGPFDKKDDADAAREKLTGAGVESSLVRVQK
jgi:cell division protein FtsN